MSGSGKTSVATALESNPCIKGTVRNIVIISADDYYKIPEREGYASAPNFRKRNPTHWDTPEAYDIDLLDRLTFQTGTYTSEIIDLVLYFSFNKSYFFNIQV